MNFTLQIYCTSSIDGSTYKNLYGKGIRMWGIQQFPKTSSMDENSPRCYRISTLEHQKQI